MDTLVQDVKYALRSLRRTPIVTAVALVTLALGIGANTAIYSTLDAMILHPVRLQAVDRLVMVFGREPSQGIERGGIAPADFADFRRDSRSFRWLAAVAGWDANLTGDALPEVVRAARCSPELFRTLGTRPILGRDFLDEEGRPGRERVVLLSDGLWRRRFAADPAVVGREIRLDGKPYTVVGVMPREGTFPQYMELWTPLAMNAAEAGERGAHYLSVVGRLREGATLAEARTEVGSMANALAARFPGTNRGRAAIVTPYAQGVVDPISPRFHFLMLATVVLVLLLACANVANLLLARGMSRQREVAVRRALGASPWRLLRQFLTESVLLALLGGALALWVARVILDWVRTSVPVAVTQYIPGWTHVALNGPVLGFTLVVALAAGIVCGLSPALQAMRGQVGEALQTSGSVAVTRSSRRLQRSLVVAQLAVALVLLVGAGLLTRGFLQLAQPDQGFDPRNVLTMRVALPATRYPSDASQATFFARALGRLNAIPGVESAVVTSRLPWNGGMRTFETVIDGERDSRPETRPRSALRTASPGFFRTLRIPQLAGRDFAPGEDTTRARVAIVSAQLARRAWPGRDAVGRRLRLVGLAGQEEWRTVVGVVGDVKRAFFDREPSPTVYLPQDQLPYDALDVAVRTSGPPASVIPAVRAAIAAVDPEQPAYDVAPMVDAMSEQISGVRLGTWMMFGSALVALFLASLGVYGVMAYAVEQRTREIGLRVALGARPADVVGLIVGQGLRLALIGVLVGLPVAAALAIVMASTFFGVVAADPLLIAAFTLILAAVALFASWLPARRASHVDPASALRHD